MHIQFKTFQQNNKHDRLMFIQIKIIGTNQFMDFSNSFMW